MTWEVITGDCLEVMPTFEANSVDTILTDPPYGLSFMGKDWDHGIPGPRFWTEALRVAKPGAMLLAFGGTRTFHRLAVAIEDAGWEIRDTILWLYGSGFPKSHDISKAIDKAAGETGEVVGTRNTAKGRSDGKKGYESSDMLNANSRKNVIPITAPATPAAQDWHGYGTALKPAHEPIIVAMKPLDGTFAQNAQRWGVAGLWIDGGRVGTEGGGTACNNRDSNGNCKGHPTANGSLGGGVMRHSANAAPAGRWPSNLIHDGSDEVLAGFPVTTSGKPGIMRLGQNSGAAYGAESRPPGTPMTGIGDTGSAARFFYTAKASRSERNAGLEGMEERRGPVMSERCVNCGRGRMDGRRDGPCCNSPEYERTPPRGNVTNHHPTVKPIALMRYLARLTKTPTGGVILDPFAGSGSTGCAAVMEGRQFIGIEQDADYADIARRRIAHWEAAEQARQLAMELG